MMFVRFRQDFVAIRGNIRIPSVTTHGPEPVKNRCYLALGIFRRDFVAGELFHHKAIKRLVTIQRIHHIVTKSPCVGNGTVILKAFRFGETHDVEPMLGPTLTVARTRQQSISNLFMSIGRRVVGEGKRHPPALEAGR